MLQIDWLRGLPARVLGASGRARVQTGVYRNASGLIAARVRLDAAGCTVERLQAAAGSSHDEAVAQLARTGALVKARLILVLSPDLYTIHPLSCPSVPPAEMRDALRWKLRDALPYAPEEAAIDFVRLAQAADANAAASLLAVAAPRQTVAQAVAPLQKAGAIVEAVDIPEMAQRNVLARLPGAGEARALLGLGEHSALLTVVHEGALCFARRIQIPRSLGMEEEDPEHVATRIATQVQRSLEVVERQSGLAPVRTVWIGPHPYCALIARCTAEQTGLDCLQLDLQSELRFAPEAGGLLPEQAYGALIAIGAALRTERTGAAGAPAQERAALSWMSRLKAA